MNKIKFEIIHKDKNTKARLGKLSTPHGIVNTPGFVSIGTAATVKSLTPLDLKELGAEIVLGNTYHLHLRPGEDVVAEFGGLSPYMGWNGPTMTDSGGYQVFSLGSAQEHGTDESGNKLNKFSSEPELLEHDRLTPRKSQTIKPARIDEEGVTFYSHLDGSERRFTPKISIQIQEKLGADLIVEFDDHESPLWNYETTKKSLERTNRWGLESLKAQTRDDQLMYGVVHGGVYENLRKQSAEFTNRHFHAVSIGGSYTSKQMLYQVIDWSVPYFDEDKPRHLLGIGEVQDIFEAVTRGMDFFDCVAPTRRGRHGSIYISPANGGNIKNNFAFQISNEEFIHDKHPLDPGCLCYTCQNFSRGYINHLFRAKELLSYRLATYHNLFFMQILMKSIREAIESHQFEQLKEQWLS